VPLIQENFDIGTRIQAATGLNVVGAATFSTLMLVYVTTKAPIGTMDGGPLQREANAANKKTVDESYRRNFCRSTCALIVVSVLVTFLLEMVLPVCCTPAPRHEPI
jgi:hypothetical protein